MSQTYQATRPRIGGYTEGETPEELYWGLVALNAGIWVSNVWGWMWSGLVSLLATAFAMLVFSRLQRTLFAS